MPIGKRSRIKVENLQQETKELSAGEQKEIVGGTLTGADPATIASFVNQSRLTAQQEAVEVASNTAKASNQLTVGVIAGLKA